MIILIVEDDETSGRAMFETLAFHGHSPLLAPSCDEASRLLSSPHAIEVMILDLRLGAERAEDFVREMQAGGVHLPPVVVLSGQALSDIKQASIEIRPFTILQKPCSTEQLLRAIELAAT
jgi:DNA-binding NtrC family response regulator